jgi:fatty acid desaturase
MLGHVALYVGVPLAVLGPWSTLLLIAVHQAAAGLYLGLVFAPNHKGMALIDADNRLGFVREQVLTARNVRPHPLVDWWYGGLNYQIEHHLFPALPRNQLRAARPIIRAFCREQGIPYHETSVAGSYREILGYLHAVGAPLRRHEQPA